MLVTYIVSPSVYHCRPAANQTGHLPGEPSELLPEEERCWGRGGNHPGAAQCRQNCGNQTGDEGPVRRRFMRFLNVAFLC